MNSLDQLADRVGRAVATLTFLERETLRLRFGLGDGFVYTTTEIGRLWKKDARFAWRVVDRAVKKLGAMDPPVTRDDLKTLHAAGYSVHAIRRPAP